MNIKPKQSLQSLQQGCGLLFMRTVTIAKAPNY
jgi:hypothetical protein